MLGSLAQAQESSECEVSLKGILHQPVDVCLPRGSFPGKVEKEVVHNKFFFWGWGNTLDYNGFLLFKTGRPWMEVSDVALFFFFFPLHFLVQKRKLSWCGRKSFKSGSGQFESGRRKVGS